MITLSPDHLILSSITSDPHVIRERQVFLFSGTVYSESHAVASVVFWIRTLSFSPQVLFCLLQANAIP